MSRPTAPGSLGVLQAFLNTVDLEGGVETFATPAAVQAWLAERDLIEAGAVLTDADRARVIAYREAVRALLPSGAAHTVASAAVAAFNAIAAGLPLVARVDTRGEARLEPARSGIDAALARLLAIALRAMVDGSWRRLRACRSDRCRWAFYDASKNQRGAWCDMAVCGNRAKVRRYQQRRRAVTG